MVGFRGGIIGIGTDIGKFWFEFRFSICSQLKADLSGSLRIQFPLWFAAISWKIAIWQDGKLSGGARDCAQRVWTINTPH